MAARSRFDMRALRSMIADAHDDEPGPVLPWSLLDGLTRVIAGVDVSICELDLIREQRVVQQGIDEDDQRSVELGDPPPAERRPFWDHYASFWAGDPPSRAGQVRCWTDRYPGRLLAQQPLYREAFQPYGMKYFMMIGLPAPAGQERNLLFWRTSGSDYVDDDKDLLALLRPHFAEIHANAVRRRRGVLTPREWEVLELVAQGHRNVEIANLLFTSVGTVRKHLEHIYDKSGVRTRGAAVAQLLLEPAASSGPPKAPRATTS